MSLIKLQEALNSVMQMDVKGHQLQDRLQFSDAGREILNKIKSAQTAISPSVIVAAERGASMLERGDDFAEAAAIRELIKAVQA